MEVKPGYKHTEVGVIPEDWEVYRLHELVENGPKNGYSSRSGKDGKGTPTLCLSATSAGRLVLDAQTIKFLEEVVSPDSDLFLKTGDVLVQRSNTLEIVGIAAIFTGPSGTFIYPDLMMRLSFKERALANWFWRYANSTEGRRFFMSAAAGSTGSMPKISGKKVREMPVPTPPLSEQEAIADALSDADALIESLEQLIAKKVKIKQGAMQELLRPKRTDQVKLLREVSSLKGRIGWQGLKQTEFTANEDEPFLITGMNFKDGAITWNEVYHISEARYEMAKDIQLSTGDVLMTKDGTIGKVLYVDTIPYPAKPFSTVICSSSDPSEKAMLQSTCIINSILSASKILLS